MGLTPPALASNIIHQGNAGGRAACTHMLALFVQAGTQCRPAPELMPEGKGEWGSSQVGETGNLPLLQLERRPMPIKVHALLAHLTFYSDVVPVHYLEEGSSLS